MKAHEVVMKWVTAELANGNLSVGDRLPGERALAETLNVSRSSLREALRVLEALGTIRTGTGSGPNAGTVISADHAQALTLALNLQLATSHASTEHVVQVRRLIESWAALHADPERGEWAAAEELLDRMEDPELSRADFLALDVEFHVLLSRAAGNPLVSAMMEALRSSIADYANERVELVPDWAAAVARLRAEHRRVFELLRSGDVHGAERALSAHITGFYDATSVG